MQASVYSLCKQLIACKGGKHVKDTDERIINAAVSVFEREGYEGATVNMIADEAKVNAVTLFRNFRSKDNIMQAVVLKNEETVKDLIDTSLHGKPETDIRACLAELGHNAIRKLGKELNLLTMVVAEGRRNPKIMNEVSSMINTVIARFEEYLNKQVAAGKIKPINTKTATVAVISYLVYTTLLRAAIGESILGDHQKAYDDFLDIFLNGVMMAKPNV